MSKKTEQSIQDILDSEQINEAQLTGVAKPLIDLEYYAQIEKAGGIEKREFTRADVAQSKLELRFTSEMQFARQYIENISLGGLFVKTDQKRNMGDTFPISFSVPLKGETRHFEFKAKVCRVTDSGLGLEFLDVSDAVRAELEAFVQSTLPQGITVRSPLRRASLDRLENLRKEKGVKAKARQSTMIRIAAIIGLIILNGVLVQKTVQQVVKENNIKKSTFVVNGTEVPVVKVRKMSYISGSREVTIEINGGQTFTLSAKDAEEVLPYHLRQSLQVLQAQSSMKPQRRSKNTRNITKLR